MMKKLINKENLVYYFIIFVFFAYLLYTSQSVTLMADDFRYSMRSCFNFRLPQERITTIWQMFETAYYDYMYHTARYATAVLIYFVLYFGTSLFKILGPIMITLQVVLAVKVFLKDKVTEKKVFMSGAIVLLFTMISPIVLDEALYWITGAVTYSWPVTFLLLQLDLLINDNQNGSWVKCILYVLLGIYLGSTAENYSIIISCVTLLVSGYRFFVEQKKDFFSKERIISIIVLLSANFIQIISPGTQSRVSTFDEQGIIGTLMNGLFSFVQYQFYLSRLVPALLLALLLCLVYRKNKKLFLVSLTTFLPIIGAICLYSFSDMNIVYSSPMLSALIVPLEFLSWHGISLNTLAVFAYYGLVLLLLIVDVLCCTWKQDLHLLVLFLYSSCSLIALIPLGGASTRTTYIAMIFMIFTVAYMMTEVLKIHRIGFILLVFVSVYFYHHSLDYLSENVKVAKEREEIIAHREEGDVIVLPKYRFTVHGNFTDENSWEHQMFKVYYEVTEKNILFE